MLVSVRHVSAHVYTTVTQARHTNAHNAQSTLQKHSGVNLTQETVRGGSAIPRVSTPPRLWTEQEELSEGEGVGICGDMIWTSLSPFSSSHYRDHGRGAGRGRLVCRGGCPPQSQTARSGVRQTKQSTGLPLTLSKGYSI